MKDNKKLMNFSGGCGSGGAWATIIADDIGNAVDDRYIIEEARWLETRVLGLIDM